jgi:ribosomal protein S8E
MKYECEENEENNEEIQSSYPDLALKEEDDFQVQKMKKKRKKKGIITKKKKKKREIITEEKENNQEIGENTDDSYCAICERDLGRPQYLRRHMKFAHDTKRKPFRCGLCDSNHKIRANTQNHIEKFHKDTPCCQKLNVIQELKRHILENHIKFDCTECESTFSKQEDLVEHLNTEHEINRQCLICQQVTVYIRTVTLV